MTTITTKARKTSPDEGRQGEEETMEREYKARFECPLCGAEVKVTGRALMPAYIKRDIDARCEGCGAWYHWWSTATETDWFLDPPMFVEKNLPLTPEGGRFVQLAHDMIGFAMQQDEGETNEENGEVQQ
jgi:predicted RNA-binding Zn-ribbon protein involved in translation (DUF1610 family)